MAKLGEAFVVIRAALGPLKAGLRAARSIVVKAMTTITNIVKKMTELAWKYTKRLAVAVTGAIIGSVYAFGKFEKAMRVATAVSETTDKQFKKMSMMAREQAMRLNVSAHDLAQGFYFLGSAGLSVSDQIKAFVPVATLAKAATIDMGSAAEMVVDTMKGFQIGFEETTRVTDIMAKTVTSSNQTFAQLGTALSMVSGIMKNAHNTLEDTNTALAIMADVGIKGSRSGMMLRRAILNLQAPMSNMRAEMDKLGIVAYDSTGKMKPFFQIVQEMGEALEGASEEQRNMAFKTIFGARAVAGQIAIFNKSREEIDAFVQSLREAGGYAESVAKKQLNSLAEQFGRLRKIVRDSMMVFGETVAPILRKYIDRLQEAGLATNTWLREHSGYISMWAEKTEAVFIFIKNVVWDFVKFMKTDWQGGLKFALDAAFAQFEAFGKALFDLFKKLFQDIALNTRSWIEEALAKQKAVKILSNEIFKELEEKEFGKKRGLMRISPSRTATVGGRAKLLELRKQAIAEAERRVSELGGAYTPAVKKELTSWAEIHKKFIQYQKDALAKIEKSMPKELKDAWSGHFSNLKDSLAEIDAKYRQVAESVGDVADEAVRQVSKSLTDKVKEIGVTTKGPVGFMGFREAWKRMAENFSRTKEDIQKRMLDEQMEANVHLQGIEANTEFLREVGKATD